MMVSAVSAKGRAISDVAFQWSGGDPFVATISSTGLVTAVGTGSATVSVSGGTKSATTVVTVVPVPVASIVITPATTSVPVGAVRPLAAVPLDAQGQALPGRPVAWTSSSPAIAAVSERGEITGVAVGQATITAASGGVTGSAAVDVTAAAAQRIVLSPSVANLAVGQQQSFSIVVVDASGHQLGVEGVQWSTSNPAAATVADGLVTAVGSGSAVITARVDNAAATASVAVTAAVVSSVSLSPSYLALSIGETGSVQAVGLNSAGKPIAGRAVTWHSLAPNFATISPAGLVTALSVGSATIRATVDGQSASGTVVIAAASVASVSVIPGALDLEAGTTGMLVATVRGAQGEVLDRTVQWSSATAQVATVSASGLVTALTPGAAVVTATVGAVSGSATVNVGPPTVASVTLLPTSLTLGIGQTGDLAATARDAGGRELAGRAALWTSAAPSVATVSQAGRVTAVSAGATVVTAAVDDRSAEAGVAVEPAAVATVSVSPKTAALSIGASRQLTAELRDAASRVLSGRPITWRSGTPAVATVSATGEVVAVATGSATITATSEGKTGTAAIAVADAPVATVTVSPSSPSIAVGGSVSLTATPLDGSGNPLSGRSATWVSGTPGVATISSGGVVTGVAVGTATVVATIDGKSGSTLVSVTAIPVASVSVSPLSADIQIGSTRTFTAVARDAGGSTLPGRVPTWSSTAPAVATVSSAGVVTAVAVGSAMIRATIEGKSAAALIAVTTIPVASVAVSPSAASVQVGGTRALAATARDAAGGELLGRTVSWTSGKVSVATVSTEGVVTAVASGAATITADVEGVAGTAAITVTVAPVSTVTVTPSVASLTVGSTQLLTAVAKDAGGATLPGRPTTWTSQSPSIATVSATGIVTAVTAGTAQIVAAVEGKSGFSTITVSPVAVASVVVTPLAASLLVGQAQQMAAVAKDAAGNPLAGWVASWSTGNPGVATVATGGQVTAVSAGSATITGTISGKSGTGVMTVQPVPAASVVVSPATATVQVGGTRSLTAAVLDSDGNPLTGRPVAWSTANPTVATVSTAGLVTALSPGVAQVSAAAEGKTGQSAITATAVPVATVTLTPQTASLSVGQSQPLTAVAKDAGGNVLTGRTAAWSSNDVSVTTVSSSGVATAVAQGSATITATIDGQSGTAAITVVPVGVATVSVTPSAPNLTVGQSTPLTAIPKDAGGAPLTGRIVAWTSGNPAAATVSSAGMVTAVAAGASTVTATVEGKTGSAAVTVSAVPVATVEVTPAVATLNIGATATLTAKARDAAGQELPGRLAVWASDDPAVATVSATGTVTAVTAGTAQITATIEGKPGLATITVSPVPAASVVVTPAAASVVVGGTQALTAVVRDAAGNPLTGRPVTWSSSTPAVATVSTGGVVTALTPGSVGVSASAEGKTGQSTITVTAVPVATVTVTPGTASVPIGQTQALAAVAKDAGGNTLVGRPTTWSTSAAAVATVSSVGLVTAVTQGAATITATVEGQLGTSAITVAPVPVATVAVTPSFSSFTVGQSTTLTATPKDAAGNPLTGRTITWASSQPAVATVSATGIVTGVAAGNANITAASEGKSGVGAVNVTAAAGPPPPPPTPNPPVFPLQVQGGKRYLVDGAGQPFFVNGDSPWLLISELTRPEIDQYLEDRRLKGINTLMVELIESFFSTGAPKNAYGDGPFLTPGDFATPNEAYFSHAEYAITKAAEKGMVVLLTPAYMGYNGAQEGWYQAMKANGATKLQAYGRYLATRFRNLNNIVWVHGGDYNPPDLSLLHAIPNGIREIDTKWLHTFHGNRGTSALGFAGSGSAPWLSLNDIYTTSSVVPSATTEYNRSTMPFFLIESYYEGSAQGFTGVAENVIRRQAYHAVLAGATGHLVGHHAIWTFSPGWTSALGSPGPTAARHLGQLMQSHAWWQLVPDRPATLLTGGAGSDPTQALASRASDGSFALLYTPSIRDLTINLSRIAGPRVQARWYDPTNGNYTTVAGSPFNASGSATMRPTGNNGRGFGDWVLVLEAVP